MAEVARTAAATASALVAQRDYGFLRRTHAAAFTALAESLPRSQAPNDPVPNAGAPGAGLAIELLGGFRVFVGAKAVPAKAWTRRKARDVFVQLVLARGRVVPRTRLIDRHWPEAEADTAHDLLRVTISSVRKALGDVVKYEDGGYRFFPPPGTSVDVETFDRAIEAGRAAQGGSPARRAFAEAVALYGGELVAGACEGAWLVRERERLRMAYLEALRSLIQLETGDAERRASYVDRLLEEVPWDVEAVRVRLGMMTTQLRTHEAEVEYERWKAAYRLTTGADAPHIWTPAQTAPRRADAASARLTSRQQQA